MKSDNKMPVEGTNQTKGVHGTNDYNNDISVGSIGTGGGDNGASTLRELRKKHNGTSASKTRRPLL
jgi:hypothetical protein